MSFMYILAHTIPCCLIHTVVYFMFYVFLLSEQYPLKCLHDHLKCTFSEVSDVVLGRLYSYTKKRCSLSAVCGHTTAQLASVGFLMAQDSIHCFFLTEGRR